MSQPFLTFKSAEVISLLSQKFSGAEADSQDNSQEPSRRSVRFLNSGVGRGAWGVGRGAWDVGPGLESPGELLKTPVPSPPPSQVSDIICESWAPAWIFSKLPGDSKTQAGGGMCVQGAPYGRGRGAAHVWMFTAV